MANSKMKPTAPQLKLLQESDLERRRLERQRASGDLPEARWLKEQLRSGKIDKRDVQIAAILGDPDALQLFPGVNAELFGLFSGASSKTTGAVRESSAFNNGDLSSFYRYISIILQRYIDRFPEEVQPILQSFVDNPTQVKAEAGNSAKLARQIEDFSLMPNSDVIGITATTDRYYLYRAFSYAVRALRDTRKFPEHVGEMIFSLPSADRKWHHQQLALAILGRL